MPVIIEVECLLNERLAEKGWSQMDLAVRTGYHRQQISRYATDETIMSVPTLFFIADIIGCRPDQLYRCVIK